MPLWILLGIAAVCLLTLGGYAAYRTLVRNSFEKRIDAALAQGHFFSPPGECVADLLAAERVEHPNSTKLSQAAQEVRSKLEPMADELLQIWYKDSGPSVDWDKLEREYSLLQSLFPSDNEIGADYAYVRGQKAIQAGNYEQARQFYQEALNKKPNWVLALNGLGKVYMRADSPFRDQQRAVGLYEQAIQADPKFTWAYVNLAIYYRLQNDLASAKTYLLKALATYPNKVSLLVLMGNVCAEGKDFHEAVEYYEKALPLETDPSAQQKLIATVAHLQGMLANTGTDSDSAPTFPPQTSSGISSQPLDSQDSLRQQDSDQPQQQTILPMGSILHPTLINQVAPAYPPAAQATGLAGRVVVEIVIDEHGDVTNARVVQCTNPIFNQAALDAVRRWKYSIPRSDDGQPVSVYWLVTLNFGPTP